ncbi:MAG: DUF1295 domain-containing protein [Hyphomonadaceae bacterium]
MNSHLTKNRAYGKSRSLLIVTSAYVLALVGAVISHWYMEGLTPLWAAFAMDIVATVIIWAIGAYVSNASVYDPYWSVIPPALALYWIGSTGGGLTTGQTLVLIVIFFWAFRLTTNWARDWPGLEHEDWRYQEMRANNPKIYMFVSNLMGINIFPTVMVFLGMLPVYVVMTGDGNSNQILDYVAAVIGIAAALIQFIADEQMRTFRKKQRNNETNEAFYTGGLWAWSRHPNYFGEVTMWFSLWLFALSAGGMAYAWTGIGWVAMLALFLFASCPWMDRRSAAKREGYAEHIENSNLFFMTPPRKKKT